MNELKPAAKGTKFRVIKQAPMPIAMSPRTRFPPLRTLYLKIR